MTASVVVVYHSGFGHTKVVAESIAKGANDSGVATCTVISVDELGPIVEGEPNAAWESLHNADAIVMGSPTYMGTVSAPFKTFMDASSAMWFEQKWRDKLAAGFTNGGGLSGDKLNTLITLSIFAAQQGMNWINAGFDPKASDGTNRMSAYLGLMTQSDNSPPSESPPESDHISAQMFGDRIAQAAARWALGVQKS